MFQCIADLQYSPIRKQGSYHVNKFSVASKLGMKVLDPCCLPGPHSRAGNEGSMLSAQSSLKSCHSCCMKWVAVCTTPWPISLSKGWGATRTWERCPSGFFSCQKRVTHPLFWFLSWEVSHTESPGCALRRQGVTVSSWHCVCVATPFTEASLQAVRTSARKIAVQSLDLSTVTELCRKSGGDPSNSV